MKRKGYLFEQVTAFDNLLLAAKKAAQGKSTQPRVAQFLFHLETELFKLQEEMQNGNWQPSEYRIFEVREPKPRRINATDFRDRVVHHAVKLGNVSHFFVNTTFHGVESLSLPILGITTLLTLDFSFTS